MVHQNLSSLLGMEAENEKKPQQIVCSRTEGLDLNERRECEELKFYWPTFTPWLALPEGSQGMPQGFGD